MEPKPLKETTMVVKDGAKPSKINHNVVKNVGKQMKNITSITYWRKIRQ